MGQLTIKCKELGRLATLEVSSYLRTLWDPHPSVAVLAMWSPLDPGVILVLPLMGTYQK